MRKRVIGLIAAALLILALAAVWLWPMPLDGVFSGAAEIEVACLVGGVSNGKPQMDTESYTLSPGSEGYGALLETLRGRTYHRTLRTFAEAPTMGIGPHGMTLHIWFCSADGGRRAASGAGL